MILLTYKQVQDALSQAYNSWKVSSPAAFTIKGTSIPVEYTSSDGKAEFSIPGKEYAMNKEDVSELHCWWEEDLSKGEGTFIALPNDPKVMAAVRKEDEFWFTVSVA